MVRRVSRIPSSARSARLAEAVRRSKDPTVFTVLLEDTAAVAGLLIALVSLALTVALDMPVLDGVASVLIGLLLAATAAFLAREAKGLLLGEAVSPGVRASLRRLAGSTPGVSGVNEILTMHFGPNDVLAAISLDFDDRQTASAVERAANDLERRIKDAHPEIRRIFIEAQSREGHLRAQGTAPLGSSQGESEGG